MRRVDRVIARLLHLERPLLVALDVDGTISPIVRDPDTAEPQAQLGIQGSTNCQPHIEHPDHDALWLALES